VLIVGMDRGGVYAYSALDGKPKWMFETSKAPVRSSPGIASKSGLVYFGCNNSKIYCLDAKTGAKE
jgi:outer membrane protein assembly factor BamB